MEKLRVDGDPYVILGACHPPLAHQALATEPEFGTLLPCNVVIYRRDDTTHIAAIDAERMLSIVGNDQLAHRSPCAGQARPRRRPRRRPGLAGRHQRQAAPYPRRRHDSALVR